MKTYAYGLATTQSRTVWNTLLSPLLLNPLKCFQCKYGAKLPKKGQIVIAIVIISTMLV